MNIASYLGQLAHVRSSQAIAREVSDELDFHIESQIRSLVRQGVGEHEARSRTLEKFGDRNRIEQQCFRIQSGPARRLVWSAGITAVIALSVIGWLLWSLSLLRRENVQLLTQIQSQAQPVLSTPGMSSSQGFVPAAHSTQEESKTLSGKVTDADGKPITGAQVLLVHKMWRDGYAQEGHNAETDENGEYRFEELYQSDIQNAFLVTVVADGFEMKSDYAVFQAGKRVRDFDLELKPAARIQFTFQDAEGKPLGDTDVVLLGRKTGTREYMLYELNAREAKKTTDENGVVEISNLLKNDTATFGVLIFDEFHHAEVEITGEESQIIRLEKKRP